MKTCVLYGPKDLRIEERPVSEPQPGFVRLRMGGVGIVALWLQDKTGFRAGWTQLLFDLVVFALALTLRDAETVAWSALGALVLNLVIGMNHRRDRYIAT